MIYLDYASTTPLDPAVRQAMEEALERWGAPSSIHQAGRRARALLEEARERLAAVWGAQPGELVFTASGTEANALALWGAALAQPKRHLITSQIEHSSVLGTLRALERLGFQLTLLPPDPQGRIAPEQVLEALSPETALVSLMWVNHELGTLQPVFELAPLLRERGILLHVDAAQVLGSIPARLGDLGADLVSVSAHKFYGPKGAGALYVRRGLELFPWLPGKQERGRRGGTENLWAAWGMALAAERAVEGFAAEYQRLLALRRRLEEGLLAVEGVRLNGHPSLRSPRIVNVTVQDADGEALLLNMDLMGVAVSSGSACSAGSLEPSYVLLAIGHTWQEARASLRFSLGRETDLGVVERAVEVFRSAVARARGETSL
jgi:cysteine desulfurase